MLLRLFALLLLFCFPQYSRCNSSEIVSDTLFHLLLTARQFGVPRTEIRKILLKGIFVRKIPCATAIVIVTSIEIEKDHTCTAFTRIIRGNAFYWIEQTLPIFITF